MYNIIQLNDKNLSELQAIAQELGIKKTDSLKKEELVYKILDEQAIAGATKKVAADKLKEERKGDKQKRSRVTVKKEGTDKVFTANKTCVLDSGKLSFHLFIFLLLNSSSFPFCLHTASSSSSIVPISFLFP